MKQKYLEGGKICSAHGIRGVMKVASYCDSPEILAAQKRVFLPAKDGRMNERAVTFGAVFGKFALLGVEGITEREQAQAMRDRVLYLAREDIPLREGDVFLADLLGLPVIDANTGRVYGKCAAVDDGVLYRLLTVSTESGEVLLPDIPEFIRQKDPDRGIFVTPIAGFFRED